MLNLVIRKIDLLDILVSFLEMISKILVSLIIILAIKYMFDAWLRRRVKNHIRKGTIDKTVTNIFKIIFLFIVLMIFLATLGIEISPVVTSAGILGAALAFGAQELISDLIAGFFIIIENIFNIGETIEIDGFMGKVLEIGFRVTKIQDYKGAIKTYNNGDIKGAINYSRDNALAVVDVEIPYEKEIDKLIENINKFFYNYRSKNDKIVEDPFCAGVSKSEDHKISLRFFTKCQPMTQFEVERSVRKDVWVCLKELGIGYPYQKIIIEGEKND